MVNQLVNKIKRAYAWMKKKIFWLLVGGTALAAWVAMIPGDLSRESSSFAEIQNGSVARVIVVSEYDLKTPICGINKSEYCWGDPKNWVETGSHDTKGRKNYAGVGYTYDKTIDAFVPNRGPGMTTFNTEKARWEVPVTTSASST